MVILIEQIEIPASYEKLHAPRPFIKRRPFDSKPPRDFEGPAGGRSSKQNQAGQNRLLILPEEQTRTQKCGKQIFHPKTPRISIRSKAPPAGC